MTKETKQHEEQTKGKFNPAAAVALGAGFGLAVGAAIGNLGGGLIIGVALGVAMLQEAKRRHASENDSAER